ncbi:MAG TPA: hypothetical protein VJ901_13820 [Thermoanaerobaculia bacterium]|nr:hypothetical protein [Thermoanaerobaculia bacterium]
MRRALAAAALFFAFSLVAQTPQQLYQTAKAAYDKKDYPAYLAAMQTLVRLRPQHPLIRQNYAGALALNGRAEESVAEIRKLIAMSVATDLSDHDFDALRSRDDFRDVERINAQVKRDPVSHASIRFRLPNDLLTESIAFDPRTKSFFVSANHPRKIIRIDTRGRVSDFVKPMDNFWGANGLAVDAKRRLLWASSRAFIRGGEIDKTHEHDTAVWAFDLDTGAVVKRLIPPPGADALDDLTLAPDGTLYVSDSQGAVLTLPPGGNELQLFVPRGKIRSSQGETVHGKYLYVADYGGGVAVIDRETRDVTHMPLPDNFPAFGIDGLAYANGWLFGVQNGVEPNRVIKLHLAPGGLSADRWEIVEMNHPLMDEPTIGTIAGDEYVFLAASQGNKFDEKKLDQLHESIVMRVKL